MEVETKRELVKFVMFAMGWPKMSRKAMGWTLESINEAFHIV